MAKGSMWLSLVVVPSLVLLQGCEPHWNPPPVSGSPATGHAPRPLSSKPLAESDVLELLASNQFAVLDEHFSSIQAEYVDGALSDEDLRNAFRVFYATATALAPKYDAWVEQFPGSYVAHLARGIYYKKLGQELRGDDFIVNTSFKQIAGMQWAYDKAALDFHASADLNEKPLLTYMHALDISRSAGRRDENRELLDLATKIDPANFVVRQRYMLSLEPRWGGSADRMRTFLEECRQANLPAERLRKLEAIIIEDTASTNYDSRRYAAAAKEYRQVLDMGGEISCLGCAAYAMADQKHYADAVEVYSMMLAQKPSDAQTLGLRAYAYSQLQNPEAIADFTAAANLGDAYSQNQLGRYSLEGVPGIVPQDRELAIRWFRKAASQGDPQGIKNLNAALAMKSPNAPQAGEGGRH
jgi:tetratricopeptide (TPR) repeat protein